MFGDRLGHPLVALVAALGLTLPWVIVEVTGGPTAYDFAPLTTVGVSGLAVLGSSFMLAWGAETAEKDVPRAFAIAVLAVLAVAPEYAVDALYAWQAGSGGATAQACAQFTATEIERGVTQVAAACHDGNLAVANMTGANRILIGIGWSAIAMYTVYQSKQTNDPAVEEREGLLADVVHIDRSLALEIVFLLIATAYALAIPLGDGIGMIDTAVLVGLYVLYILVILRGDVEEVDDHVGVPAYLQQFAKPFRAASSIALFLYSGVMIYTAVHPFAHGLEELGQAAGIPAFFMIQWIAPLASESPELIVVAYLVNKARSTAGFNALISSKLNQWTLLIGTLAVVFSIAGGQVGTLPFDARQSAEIWITAAQSFFAVAIITNFNISVREALLLLGLFVSQVVVEFAIIRMVADPARATELSILVLDGYAVVYLVLGLALFFMRRDEFAGILRTTKTTVQDAIVRDDHVAETSD